MFKRILLVFFIVSYLITFSQSTDSCSTVTISNKAEAKNNSDCVLKATQTILSNPLLTKSDEYIAAGALVESWAEFSPKKIKLTAKLSEVLKDGNKELYIIYLSSMSQAYLRLKKNFETEGFRLFVEFIRNSNQHIKITPKLNKMLEDYDKGLFMTYVG